MFEEKMILNNDPAYVKISIVTPSYNQAEFLERTILSVLSQGYPNLEYIVIDGGSTDGSIGIIKKYEKYLAYWVSEPDKGQSDAINNGFQKSTGGILAYINSDDTYRPGTFLKVAQAHMENPGTNLFYGNVDIVDAHDNLIDKFRTTKLDPLLLVNYKRCYIHQQGAFWTRDIYDRVGGFNPDYQFCMDFDFFCRAAETARIVHIPDCLANFRIHKDSKSSKMKQVYRIENEEIMRRYIKDNKRLNAAYFLCEIRRIYLLIMQGDADYILRKVYKRTKNLLWKK